MRPGIKQVISSWLLVVSALLAVALVMLTQNTVTSSELQARQHSLLKVFRDDEVTRIEVERGDERVVLLRAGGSEVDQFRLTQPVQERAKQEKVDALLSSLRFATYIRKVDEKVARTTLGFDKPGWVLHLMVGKIQYGLRLGAAAIQPPGSHYLEVSGEGAPGKGVYLVRAGLVDELSVGAADFRSHDLATVGKDSLKTVHLQHGDVQWQLRNDAGRWRFVDRFSGALVDRDVVDAFFLRLARLQFEEFLDPEQARGLLAQPATRVTLGPKDAGQEPVEIQLGGHCPGAEERVVALRKTSNLVAGCVAAEFADALAMQPDQLLSTRLFDLRLDEVEVFQLERAGATLTLTRIPGGFRMTSPEQGDVDRQLGEQRVRSWLELQGTPLFEETPRGQQIEASVQIRGVSDIPDPYREQRVELMPSPKGNSMLVRRLTDGVVLEVPRIDPMQLDVSGLMLKDRVILDLQAKDLQRIEVTAPGFHQVLQRSGESMSLSQPPDLAADAILVQELQDGLRNLTALRWVALRGGTEYGLDQPRIRAQFLVGQATGEPQAHVLQIGSSTSGGFFAQLDEGAVFVLSRRVVQSLTTWAVERLLLTPDFERCSRIELKTPEVSVALQRDAERFVFVDPSSQSDPAVLVEGLRGLRSEAAVHPGAPRPFEGFERPRLELVTRGDDGEITSRWSVGAADVVDGMSVFYVRFAGVNATYAISRAPIQRLLDLL